MSKTADKFSPEVRQRAVRLVPDHEHEHEHEHEHPFCWAAVLSITSKIGCTGQTLKEWVMKAEDGRLSLVAKHGRPLFVAVPLDEHLLRHGVAVALACRLYAERTVSLGKAAKLAGLSVEAFVERLGAMGIPAVDAPAEEIEQDLTVLAR